MAKRELKSRAIEMRLQGMSYSQIKEVVGVSKSTLSNWLKDMPLSTERIHELRDTSSQRIERCRETKRQKRIVRREGVYKEVVQDIDQLNDREVLLSGLFLYWGEGAKTTPGTVSISNTDPAVARCFIKWLMLFDVDLSKIKVYLHLYSDMDIDAETKWWSRELEIPLTQFRKSYVKESKRADIKYGQKFTHGTCNVVCYNVTLFEYVTEGLAYLRRLFALTE